MSLADLPRGHFKAIYTDMAHQPGRNARITDIIILAARLSRRSVADITGPNRLRANCGPRFAVCIVARENGHSFTQIGVKLNRDHSSMVYASRRGRAVVEQEPAYATFIEQLRNLARDTPAFIAPESPIDLPSPIFKAKQPPRPLRYIEIDQDDEDELDGLRQRDNLVAGSKKLAAALLGARA